MSKIFIRGNVRKSKFGIKVSIHKDALNQIKGDYLNFEIKESREGKMYMKLDTWEPRPSATGTHRIITTLNDLPSGNSVDSNTPSIDELPF